MPKKYAFKTDVSHKAKQKKNHFAITYVEFPKLWVKHCEESAALKGLQCIPKSSLI